MPRSIRDPVADVFDCIEPRDRMIRYRINRELSLIVVRYEGVVTLADWQHSLGEIVRECPEVVTYDSINDNRPLKEYFAAGLVRQIAAASRKMGMMDHPRRSVLLTDDKIVFGMSRMFELITEQGSKVRRLTTGSVEEAAKWLGRPLALLQSELEAAANAAGA